MINGNDRRKLVLLFAVLVALIPMSCTLNPLSGFLTGLSVKIISPLGNTSVSKPKVKQNTTVQIQSTVPSQPATGAGTTTIYDCVAFNVTGYGIDIKDFPETELPLDQFQFGAETPMQDPKIVSALTFNIQIPTLLGVSPQMQRRLIQVYGVLTSKADKTSCRGKNLSDFLLNEDRYAAVYRIGSGNYPAEGVATCTGSDLCIINDTLTSLGGPELISMYIQNTNEKVVVATRTWDTGLYPGISLFNNDDFDGFGGFLQSNNSLARSKPMAPLNYPRIDLYFELSDYYRERIRGYSTYLKLNGLNAKNYTTSSGICTEDEAGSYSAVTIKYWDPTNTQWADPPRLAGAVNSNIIPAGSHSSGFDLDVLDINSSNTLTVEGKKYLVFSIRTNSANCSSLEIEPFSQVVTIF